MDIIKSCINDTEKITDFYYRLIDDMQNMQYAPGWKKDIYPDREYLADAIREGCLFIGIDNNDIVAAMILNNHYEDAYKQCRWTVDAADDEIMVIHTLAVATEAQGKGYAKQLVRFAQNYAKENGYKVMRLDVLEGNVPAEKLYPSVGFTFRDKVQIFYEDTGEASFLLYELEL